jgi:hypothetical protein
MVNVGVNRGLACYKGRGPNIMPLDVPAIVPEGHPVVVEVLEDWPQQAQKGDT